MNNSHGSSRISSNRGMASRVACVVVVMSAGIANALAGAVLPPVAASEPSGLALAGAVVAAGLVARWAVRRRGKKRTDKN